MHLQRWQNGPWKLIPERCTIKWKTYPVSRLYPGGADFVGSELYKRERKTLECHIVESF